MISIIVAAVALGISALSLYFSIKVIKAGQSGQKTEAYGGMEREIGELKEDISEINTGLNGIKQDIAYIKERVGMEREIGELKEDISEINTGLNGIKQDIAYIKDTIEGRDKRGKESSKPPVIHRKPDDEESHGAVIYRPPEF